MLFPAWVTRRGAARENDAASQSFLADILEAQYSLFLFVRIHDDVLDGQHNARPLVGTADRLAIGARHLFVRHFPPASGFWRYYERMVGQSLAAIGEVAALQRARKPSPPRLVRAYARVNRVLLVATVAACLRRRHADDLALIIRAADDLAIGSQILDDLQDVREDLERGCVNYVAVQALRSPLLSRHGGRTLSLASFMAQSGLIVRVLEDVRRRFRRARTTLHTLGIAETEATIQAYERALGRLQLNILRRDMKSAEAVVRRGQGRR